MASGLSAGDLKELLNRLADDSEDTSNNLSNFSDDFDEQSQNVANALEGTSTGVDQDIARIFQKAQESLNKTVEALVSAAQAARDYAETL